MHTRTWSFGKSLFFVGVALAAAILVDQVVGCLSAPAQQQSPGAIASAQLPATADDVLRQMSLSAGIIFVGQVLEVRRPGGMAGTAQDAAEGLVKVDFRVDQAVRGVAAGSIYTLREWGGLWTSGFDRYRVGQHLLMLLRSPDNAGLSSPVHGAEGAIPLRGAGVAPGPNDAVSTPAEWTADMRWLEAQTPQQQLRIIPGHTLPVRGRGRLHSEAASGRSEDFVPEKLEPLLVQALTGPWTEAPTTQAFEPLSHVLGLCALSAETKDARVIP